MITIYTDTSIKNDKAVCTSLLISDTNFIGLVTQDYSDLYGSVHGELLAILQGLQKVAPYTEPIEVYTDSKEAINLIRNKTTSEYVSHVVKQIQQFPDVKYLYIKGHRRKHSPNKVVDVLARKVANL